MPIIYSLIIRQSFYQLMERCLLIKFHQSIMKICFFLLLSFFTTIIINILLFILFFKTSPLSISSSFNLQITSHIFFPSDIISLYYSPTNYRDLQNQYQEQDLLEKIQIYTKNHSQQNNISNDLRHEAVIALHSALNLITSNKFKKARKVFEHALNLDPSNSEILVEYGQFLEYHHNDLINAEHYYTRALVKQPTNLRALELKKRTLPLVEEIDQKYFYFIDNILKEFYRIPDTNPYLRRAKRNAYYLHIYHSNGIEGNTLNLRETQYIIETHLAIGGKSLIEQQEVLGLDLALQYVNCTLVNRLGLITLEDILEIHRRVLGFVNPIEAGQLRKQQVYVGSFIPPIYNDLPEYLDDFLKWLNSLDDTRDLHAIELATIAHYKFVYIHPFIDGNGRTGRLLMNLILMKFGYPPVIIKKSERFIYYSHLKQANDGDIRPLIRFIAKCTERTLTELIQQSQTTKITRQDLRLNDDYDNGRNFIEERVIIIE
ncbi:unnamed protein product [Rotaria sp. Silwood1]|nr:unnamed protein product [Rotaria sp. Silwood1]CAF1311816.1 unnamed protein product [Rotaria sp. Silwood1]